MVCGAGVDNLSRQGIRNLEILNDYIIDFQRVYSNIHCLRWFADKSGDHVCSSSSTAMQSTRFQFCNAFGVLRGIPPLWGLIRVCSKAYTLLRHLVVSIAFVA